MKFTPDALAVDDTVVGPLRSVYRAINDEVRTEYRRRMTEERRAVEDAKEIKDLSGQALGIIAERIKEYLESGKEDPVAMTALQNAYNHAEQANNDAKRKLEPIPWAERVRRTITAQIEAANRKASAGKYLPQWMKDQKTDLRQIRDLEALSNLMDAWGQGVEKDAVVKALARFDLSPDLIPTDEEVDAANKIGFWDRLFFDVIGRLVGTTWKFNSGPAKALGTAVGALFTGRLPDKDDTAPILADFVMAKDILFAGSLAREENRHLNVHGQDIVEDVNRLVGADTEATWRDAITTIAPLKVLSKEYSDEKRSAEKQQIAQKFLDLKNERDSLTQQQLSETVYITMPSENPGEPDIDISMTRAEHIARQMQALDKELFQTSLIDRILDSKISAWAGFLLDMVMPDPTFKVAKGIGKAARFTATSASKVAGNALIKTAESINKVPFVPEKSVSNMKTVGGLMNGSIKPTEIEVIRKARNSINSFKGLVGDPAMNERLAEAGKRRMAEPIAQTRKDIQDIAELVEPEAAPLFTTKPGNQKAIAATMEMRDEVMPRTHQEGEAARLFIEEHLENATNKARAGAADELLAKHEQRATEQLNEFTKKLEGNGIKIKKKSAGGPEDIEIDVNTGEIKTPPEFDTLPADRQLFTIGHESAHYAHENARRARLSGSTSEWDDFYNPHYNKYVEIRDGIVKDFNDNISYRDFLLNPNRSRFHPINNLDQNKFLSILDSPSHKLHAAAVRLARKFGELVNIMPAFELSAWTNVEQLANRLGGKIDTASPVFRAHAKKLAGTYLKQAENFNKVLKRRGIGISAEAEEASSFARAMLGKATDDVEQIRRTEILKMLSDDDVNARAMQELYNEYAILRKAHGSAEETLRAVGIDPAKMTEWDGTSLINSETYTVGNKLVKDLGIDKQIRESVYLKHGLSDPEIRTLENMREFLEKKGQDLADNELVGVLAANYTPRMMERIEEAARRVMTAAKPGGWKLGKDVVFPTLKEAQDHIKQMGLQLNQRYADVVANYANAANRRIAAKNLVKDFEDMTGWKRKDFTPEMERLVKMVETGGAPKSAFIRGWNKYFLDPIKETLLTGHPAYNITNALDNAAKSMIFGGMDTLSVSNLINSAKIYINESAVKTMHLGKGVELTHKELSDLAWKYGVLKIESVQTGGRSSAYGQMLRSKIARKAGGIKAKVGKVFDVLPISLQAAAHTDNIQRMNLWLNLARKNIAAGMPVKEALWKARLTVGKALVDLEDAGPLVQVLATALPFARFQARNFATYMEAVAKHADVPWRIMSYIRNFNHSMGGELTLEDKKYLSPYLREQLLINLGHDLHGNTLLLSRLGLSHEQITDFYSHISVPRQFEKLASQVLPLNFMLALVSDTHPFFGTSYDAAQARKTTKFFATPFWEKIIGPVKRRTVGEDKYGKTIYKYEWSDTPTAKRAAIMLGPIANGVAAASLPVLKRFAGETLGGIIAGQLSSRGIAEWSKLTDDSKTELVRLANYLTRAKIVSVDINAAVVAKEMERLQMFSREASRAESELLEEIIASSDPEKRDQLDTFLKTFRKGYKTQIQSIDEQVFNR